MEQMSRTLTQRKVAAIQTSHRQKQVSGKLVTRLPSRILTGSPPMFDHYLFVEKYTTEMKLLHLLRFLIAHDRWTLLRPAKVATPTTPEGPALAYMLALLCGITYCAAIELFRNNLTAVSGGLAILLFCLAASLSVYDYTLHTYLGWPKTLVSRCVGQAFFCGVFTGMPVVLRTKDDTKRWEYSNIVWGTMLAVIAVHDFILVGRLMKGSTAWELFYPLSHANERREQAQEGFPMT